MQDIHSFESSAGGGDRRLRHHHHQDTKCPRCDSSNTKFCYYNNYNLSQPRHFCKSCRRYWTKGGVLRNVPVGGGIRKAKRSSKSKSKTSIPSSDAVAAQRKSSNSENSSSDSSSLTANTTTRNTTATTTPITTTDVSGSNSTNSTSAMMLNFNDSSRFFNIPQSSTPITTVDPLMLSQSSAGKMSSEIGTFTGLMASSTDQLSDIPSIQLQQQNTEHAIENQNPYQLQWTVETTGFMDQTAEIELSRYGNTRSNGGLAGVEGWQEITDEGLFDLTGNVDQSYWNQSQWNDDDHDHDRNYKVPNI